MKLNLNLPFILSQIVIYGNPKMTLAQKHFFQFSLQYAAHSAFH